MVKRVIAQVKADLADVGKFGGYLPVISDLGDTLPPCLPNWLP